LTLAAACTRAPAEPAASSASFREKHDFESLSRLLGHLRLGMTRAEVEKLLGEPTYSPIEGQYYYHTSDRVTPEGTPVGLVMDYRRTNPRTGEEIASGRLETFWMGPIGE
jgi:hypothetical protein